MEDREVAYRNPYADDEPRCEQFALSYLLPALLPINLCSGEQLALWRGHLQGILCNSLRYGNW